jgi:hypothetical protein
MTLHTSRRPDKDQFAFSALGGGGQRLPPASLAAVVIALSGLVALASQGAPLWTPLRIGAVNRSELLVSVAIVDGVGIVAAFAIILIVHRILRTRRGAITVREMVHRAVPITSVMLAALTLITIARADLQPGRTSTAGAVEQTVAGREGQRPAGPGLRDSRTGLIVAGEDSRPHANGVVANPRSAPLDAKLLLLLAVGAAAVVGAVFRWSRGRRSSAPGLSGADDGSDLDRDVGRMRDVVLGTIDAMLADPDPNTAIIGAYARLLEGFAASGVERRMHEAPLEHLRRALATLLVRPEPAHRLVELFAAARFSTHRLTTEHREQALEALRAAAADLDLNARADTSWRPAEA